MFLLTNVLTERIIYIYIIAFLGLFIGWILGQYERENGQILALLYLLLLIYVLEEWWKNRLIYLYQFKPIIPTNIPITLIDYVGDKEPRILMTKPKEIVGEPILFPFLIIQDPKFEIEINWQEKQYYEFRLFKNFSNIKKLV